MVKPDPNSLKPMEPSASDVNNADELDTRGMHKRTYLKPALTKFGQIDQITLGSGGSCTDGVNFDKALTGSGKCP